MADVSSFRALYDSQYKFVWFSLRGLGIPPKDLPDVTHDVFVQVHRCLAIYDVQRPFRPWLYGIVFRVASTYKQLHRNKYELLGEVPSDLRDVRPTPEEEASRREEMTHIERVLASIGHRHRIVLTMYDFQGESAKAIAAACAIPLKTVYSRLKNGRLQLAQRSRQLKLNEPSSEA